MTTDNKTLADAQPGGRVRLATVPYDRARDLLGDAYNAGTHGIGYSQQAMELHDAIFSAQHSPGGQGDAFSSERVRWFKRTGEYLARAQAAEAELASFDRFRATSRRQSAVELLLNQGFIWNGVEWKARQPVASNQVVEDIEQLPFDTSAQPSGNSGELAVDTQPVGYANIHQLNDPRNDGVVLRRKDDDGFFTEPLYRRPPAQAVDLGRWSQRHADDLHVAVHTALSVHAGSLSQKKRAAISAYVKRLLIDSQAVGNG